MKNCFWVVIHRKSVKTKTLKTVYIYVFLLILVSIDILLTNLELRCILNIDDKDLPLIKQAIIAKIGQKWTNLSLGSCDCWDIKLNFYLGGRTVVI